MRARRLLHLLVLVPVVMATSACITVRDDDGDDGRRGMHSRMGDAQDDRRCDRDWRMPGRMMMPGGMMPGRMMPGRTMMATLNEEEFLVEMIAHHEEAVAAATELERSGRASMRRLGEAIVTSQTAQVEDMRAWIEEWYDEVPEADYAPMMRDLTGLDGDRLDRIFLQDMVRHHMMAVMMANRLLACGDDLHDEVEDLARSISREQRQEIVAMSVWLRRWFGVTWGPGSMRGMGWSRRMHGF